MKNKRKIIIIIIRIKEKLIKLINKPKIYIYIIYFIKYSFFKKILIKNKKNYITKKTS